MRRVQGRTLTALLAEADTRETRLALLPLVTRVAQTIGFAHDRGVIHRDIKPDNILIGDHGEVVVLDWGLARVRGVPVEGVGSSDLPSSNNQTLHGAVIGTPAYMAPEQASGELDRIDERSDVFALGSLLFHVLTGRPPYRGSTVEELLAAARVAEDRARWPAGRSRRARARAVAIGIDVVTVLALVFAVLGLAIVVSVVSTFHAQGLASFVSVGFGITGLVASVIEWWTRGPYRLGPLALAFAAMTLFVAIAGAASGASLVFGALAEVTDPATYRSAMANGLYEVLGQVAIAATLSGAQLLLWAAAKRRAPVV